MVAAKTSMVDTSATVKMGGLGRTVTVCMSHAVLPPVRMVDYVLRLASTSTTAPVLMDSREGTARKISMTVEEICARMVEDVWTVSTPIPANALLTGRVVTVWKMLMSAA